MLLPISQLVQTSKSAVFVAQHMATYARMLAAIVVRTDPPNGTHRVAPLLIEIVSRLSAKGETSRLSTWPCCASWSILSICVARMFVERAPGQNTTSKPAPDGMMKVDV